MSALCSWENQRKPGEDGCLQRLTALLSEGEQGEEGQPGKRRATQSSGVAGRGEQQGTCPDYSQAATADIKAEERSHSGSGSTAINRLVTYEAVCCYCTAR